LREVSKTSHATVSDFDYMISPEEIASFTSFQTRYLIVNTDDEILDPGLVKLINNNDGQTISAKSLKESLFVATNAVKVIEFPEYELPQQVYHCCVKYPTLSYIRVKVKGPAIELNLGTAILTANCFYSDFTFAIKCSQWPDTASDWTNRPNKLWPDSENIVRIASYGCYIVPKSQPGDKEGLTWRISFSKAEVEFSKLIPKIPQMCMMRLKVIAVCCLR